MPGHVAEPTFGSVVDTIMDVIAILMGWPSLGSALLLSGAGAWLQKPALVWIGVALTIPMALYLSASPAYPFVGLVPLVALVIAAVTCRTIPRWRSMGAVAVYGAFLLALAFLVVNESH